nr:isochorismatase family protein [Cryobacterium lyxosi]
MRSCYRRSRTLHENVDSVEWPTSESSGDLDEQLLCASDCSSSVESHLRELLEQGFDVAVVADATAAAQHPELGDGYAAALTNFNYIAGVVLTTERAIEMLESAVSVGDR